MNIKGILNNLPAGKQRDIIANIISGRIVKQVKCQSRICGGRIIAHIYNDGRVEANIVKDVMWLFAHRQRLDGSLGFQCRCGNDSRLCEAEVGVSGIEHNNVTQKDLNEVWDRLQKKPASYKTEGRKTYVDNFIIEEI